MMDEREHRRKLTEMCERMGNCRVAAKAIKQRRLARQDTAEDVPRTQVPLPNSASLKLQR